MKQRECDMTGSLGSSGFAAAYHIVVVVKYDAIG